MQGYGSLGFPNKAGEEKALKKDFRSNGGGNLKLNESGSNVRKIKCVDKVFRGKIGRVFYTDSQDSY